MVWGDKMLVWWGEVGWMTWTLCHSVSCHWLSHYFRSRSSTSRPWLTVGKWNYRKWNHINGGTILIDCPWIILGENLKDLEEEKSVYNPIFEKKKSNQKNTMYMLACVCIGKILERQRRDCYGTYYLRGLEWLSYCYFSFYHFSCCPCWPTSRWRGCEYSAHVNASNSLSTPGK